MTEKNVIIGLTNPKSPTNVGSAMRAVGCYQADEVRYTGDRFDKAVKFYTDTQSVARVTPHSRVDSFFDDLPEGMEVVCIELVEGAEALPTFKHPERAIYVFGPEDGSISQDVVNRADHVVYVPTVGCMNLAATVNVLLYDRMAKQKTIEQGDGLIRQSRDSRNRLKRSS